MYSCNLQSYNQLITKTKRLKLMAMGAGGGVDSGSSIKETRLAQPNHFRAAICRSISLELAPILPLGSRLMALL
jgi:hypothetical protein